MKDNISVSGANFVMLHNANKITILSSYHQLMLTHF